MRVVAVRHLPTAMNRQGLLQGRRNDAIEEPGPETLRGIARNREKLLDLEPFDLVLVSPLKRTAQTAAAYGFEAPREEALLTELDFGPFEGQPKADMIAEIGPAWTDDPRSLVLGEPIVSLEDRILLFLRGYRDSAALLLFGHGSWIRGLVSIVRQGDVGGMNTFALENNSLTELMIPERILERVWVA